MAVEIAHLLGSAGPLLGVEDQQCRCVDVVRRWFDGSPLTVDERCDLSSFLPDAVIESPVAGADQPMTAAEAMAVYSISRATYFRWKKQGGEVPEGPDLTPWEQPRLMVAWYERMRARGIFKQQCPRRLRDLSASGIPAAKPSASSTPKQAAIPSRSDSPPSPSPSSLGRVAPEARGFLVEHEKLEEHAALLRMDYIEAYERGDIAEGDRLKQRYLDIYTELRKSASQKATIGLAEKSLVKKSEVADILGAIIPAAVETIASESESRALFDAARSLDFAEFHKDRRARLKASFMSLHKSGFAPPLELAS